jgi:hypothetical protein
LKQKQKIKKLNCKNCGSYYADIYIEINATGELTAVVFKKRKMCGQPISNDTIINAFEESLKAQTFNYLKKQAIYCQIWAHFKVLNSRNLLTL